MRAKNESSAVSAPVRSRSKIIADQMAAAMPVRPVAEAPAPVVPTKPRMSLADFQAAAAITAASEWEKGAELSNAELGGMSEADVLRLLAEFDEISLKAKLLYQRKDEIESQLIDALKVGDVVVMADGRRATLEDNFSGVDRNTGRTKNVSFRPCGVKRFEISITKSKK